jgi:DNA repair protein RadD
MITLRPYQEAAKAAIFQHLRRRDDNLCVVIPTAGGKTPVIASVCRDAVTRWNGRVLILAHVKELLQQAADKLQDVCSEVKFGVYSAGLKRRDTENPVIVAGVQSVHRRACELGAFDLIIVDEAHLIPTDGEGRYHEFLKEAKVVNPQVRVIGLTATPYRMKTGMICGPDNILNHVCFEIGVGELIRDGYLSPLSTEPGDTTVETDGLHIRGGDFVADEVADLMDQDELVKSACREIVERTGDRGAVLVFTSGVEHGRHVQRVIEEHGVPCGFVCGDTPTSERDDLLGRFRGGELKYLANVNVLTTGFDAPNIDCVSILRPTLSPGLYYQMVGRGFRLHPGKTDCLVLDFGGNIARHGPVDQIRPKEPVSNGNGQAPVKTCPECNSVVAAGYAFCPICGFMFPPPDRQKHDAQASEASILSGQMECNEYQVRDVIYSVHTKRDAPADAPKTLRVNYRLGLNQWHSEYICLEHQGFARAKAIQWWRERSPDPVPDTAERAVEIAEGGGVALAEAITLERMAGDKFGRIVNCKLGPLPEPLPVCETLGHEEEIPF